MVFRFGTVRGILGDFTLNGLAQAESAFIKMDAAAGEELPMGMGRERSLEKTRSTLNVEEEYMSALRTKSYTDMWTKLHHRGGGGEYTQADEEEENTLSSPLLNNHFAHRLLDPNQDTLLTSTAASDDTSTHLLLDYLDTTLQACDACASLLASIHRTTSRHRSIQRLLLNLFDSPVHNHDYFTTIVSDLASYVELENPLSTTNMVQFHRVHAHYAPLIQRLKSAHRRITRRAKLIRLVHKVYGFLLVTAVCGVDSMGPHRCGEEVGHLTAAAAQMDAAAKGAYIMERDFDTMKQMVRRVEDEVEHGKYMVRMYLRNRESQLLLREVVMELENEEGAFRELMEELKEHVFLCLVNINRTRRLVAQEMVGLVAPTSTTLL